MDNRVSERELGKQGKVWERDVEKTGEMDNEWERERERGRKDWRVNKGESVCIT